MDYSIGSYELRGLSNLNVVLGKNGCGKSTLLKAVDTHLLQNEVKVRYLSPERGGALQYNPGQEQNILQNPRWLGDDRRRNQAAQFRVQSVALFRTLEIQMLRRLDSRVGTGRDFVPGRDLGRRFDSVVSQINALLDHIVIRQKNTGFTIHAKDTGDEIPPDQISSGESELISLAIECLAFTDETRSDAESVLLMDEPDLHLHPDLQSRFGRFLSTIARQRNVRVLLATHSTALVGAFTKGAGVRVALMRKNDTVLEFSPVTDIHRKVLPVFGAHLTCPHG